MTRAKPDLNMADNHGTGGSCMLMLLIEDDTNLPLLGIVIDHDSPLLALVVKSSAVGEPDSRFR